jgi:thiol-disulfide isomerase/thioredoxin
MIENNKQNAVVNLKTIKKHFSTILFVIVIALLMFSPKAKSFLIKQLMFTGLFDAEISSINSVDNAVQNHFDYEDYEGIMKSTADLKGKVVFINFWASWCPPCIAEYPSIEKFYTQYKSNDKIVFLMINMDDDIEIGKQFLINKKYSLPIFQAVSKIPNEIYSGALPTTVIVDKKGIIRMRHEGFAD